MFSIVMQQLSIIINQYSCLTFDAVVRLLAYYARGREFDPVQYKHLCILGGFYE
jgi:hypothetical protein